ncbi:hypothetical protein ACFQZX_01060 [Mucilaginibacter litoreus]|uniref:Lipoprotein n=1 Tax=Mucilaginibacter litoreus TaxID=1048221 RepID=A0ABW3AMI0_9SPHI
MKRYIIIFAFAMASCAGNGNKGTDTTMVSPQHTSDTAALNAPAQNMEYCFIHTEGTSNQDTTAVHLKFNANNVTGEMKWIPKEKDARKGTLSGTIKGDIIKAVWAFMQEGTKDSIAVEFKLSAQQLAQKPYKVDTNTGRQLTDESAEYSVIYKLDNCSQFKTPGTPSL